MTFFYNETNNNSHLRLRPGPELVKLVDPRRGLAEDIRSYENVEYSSSKRANKRANKIEPSEKYVEDMKDDYMMPTRVGRVVRDVAGEQQKRAARGKTVEDIKRTTMEDPMYDAEFANQRKLRQSELHPRPYNETHAFRGYNKYQEEQMRDGYHIVTEPVSGGKVRNVSDFMMQYPLFEKASLDMNLADDDPSYKLVNDDFFETKFSARSRKIRQIENKRDLYEKYEQSQKMKKEAERELDREAKELRNLKPTYALQKPRVFEN